MADQKSNWLWWTLGGVALLGVGVGTYLYIKGRANKDQIKAELPPSPPTASSGSGSGKTTTSITNPFKNENEVKAFQQWSNSVKNTNLVVDGKYGPLTNAEYQKYYQEYIAAITSQNTPNLSEGFSKIKSQMLDKKVWGDNSSINVDSSGKLRFAINVAGGNDLFANFIPSGYFWVETIGGEQKYGGTWSYANGLFSLKMEDNSFQGSDNEISEMIKQIMKSKFPTEMQYYSFSNGVDEMMNMTGKQYVDSQDSML
jgi:hypothetical protein